MRPTRPRVPGEAGYSLVELLISTAIMITVTGAIFALMNPSQGSAQAQPEVADMQQRMRVGNETLFKELVMAGAGPYQGAIRGSLDRFLRADHPAAVGQDGAGSADDGREDRRHHARPTSRTRIRRRPSARTMPNTSAELKVNGPAQLPGRHRACAGSTTAWRSSSSTTTRQLRHVHDHPGAGRGRAPAAPGPDLEHTVQDRARRSRRSRATPTSSIARRNKLMRDDGGRQRRPARGQRRGPAVRLLRRPQSAAAAQASARRRPTACGRRRRRQLQLDEHADADGRRGRAGTAGPGAC